MAQLRALGSSFPFLPDNTDFGAVSYKRKKINVLHSEHFPTTHQAIQGFLQAEMFSIVWIQGAFPLYLGSFLEYSPRSLKCLLQCDMGQHWAKAQKTCP